MPRGLPSRGGEGGGFRRERPEGGDREGYRRAAGDKKVGPGSDFKPEFVCEKPSLLDSLLGVARTLESGGLWVIVFCLDLPACNNSIDLFLCVFVSHA